MIVAVSLPRREPGATPGVRLFVELGKRVNADVLDGRRVRYSRDMGTLTEIRDRLRSLDWSRDA